MQRYRPTFKQVEATAAHRERKRRFKADLKTATQGLIDMGDPDTATHDVLSVLCQDMKIDKAIVIQNLQWWLELLKDH